MSSIRNLLLFTTFLIFPLSFALFTNAQELVTNGDFEAGGLDGWNTAANGTDDNECGFFRYSGTKSFNQNSILAPPFGNHAASSDTLEPPCSSAIFQNITVPSGQKVSCFLIYYYQNSNDEFIIGPGLNSSDLGTANQQARNC